MYAGPAEETIMKPCIFYFKVFRLTMVTLILSMPSFDTIESAVTFFTVNNISAPVCTRQHLCRNTGCSTNQTFPQFCHCDDACTYFGDCCIDYKEACSIDVDHTFQRAVVTRQIKRADFKCETTNLEDNDSYWMVSKCDKNLGLVSERCENPVCNDTLSSIPVTDSSGVSYRNVYCAVCHNVETSTLTAWEATYDCPFEVLPDQSAFDIHQICSECSFTVYPAPPASKAPPTGQLTAARTCEPHVIANCIDVADDSCNMYTAVIEGGNQLFKNSHCYACGHIENGESIELLNCEGGGIPNFFEDSSRGWRSDFPPNSGSMFAIGAGMSELSSEFIPPFDMPVGVPLSVVLDFSSTKSSSVKIIHNQEIIKETVVSCPDGQVYLELQSGGNCVYLSCPRGFTLRDGDCLPEYPSDRATLCANEDFNNTIILTATLGTSIKSCQDASLTNVSEDFLVHLFGHSLLFEDVYTKWSAICEDVFEDTVNVTYTLSNTTDLFEFAQDSLDKTSNWNSRVYTTRTTRDIRQVDLLRSCLNAGIEYSCDSDWLSENEYIIRNKNGSQVVFLNSTAKLQVTDGVLYRVRYQSHNSTLGYTKNTQIKICNGNNYFSCAFVTLNRSLFIGVDSTNGTLKYIPNGRMFNSSEYMITSDEEILVCNFLNQTAVINATEIVTFFEYSKAQTIVSIVGSALSLVAIILTFITYAVFANLRNRASRLIMNLVMALFMGQFLLLFGGNAAQNEGLCFAIAALAHYSWLAAFAWMNAVAFDLNRTFGNPDNLRTMSQGKKYTIWNMIYAWGVPLLIVIPCVVVHFCQCTTIRFRYGNLNTCWITDGTANLLTFGFPAGIFLLLNVGLFGHTVAGIRSTKNATARVQQDTSKLKRSRMELVIYIKIASLMGFTWIFGYFAAFTGVEALWYIYIILNSLQGVFIFISFICNRRVAILWINKLKLSSLIASTPETMSSKGTKKRSGSAAGTDTTRCDSNSYTGNSRHRGEENNHDSTQPLQGEAKV